MVACVEISYYTTLDSAMDLSPLVCFGSTALLFIPSAFLLPFHSKTDLYRRCFKPWEFKTKLNVLVST